MYFVFFLYLARKSEIIRSTELLLDAISSNDFESYAYVEFANSHIRVLHFHASLQLNLQKNVLFLRTFFFPENFYNKKVEFEKTKHAWYRAIYN